MQILNFAMQMEKDGERYYRQLAQQTSNEGMRRIFAMLADEEVKHYEAVKTIETEEPELAETTIIADVKNIFQQIKDSGEEFDFGMEHLELYRNAQEIEQKSRDFYLEYANQIPQEDRKQLFFKLAEEEKKHYFLLDNIIEFVAQPEYWLENAEFYHLDEY